MLTIDFAEAKTKHLLWLTKLQAYLDGNDGLSEEQIISSHVCDLGKWLDTEGKMKYSGMIEMQELEKAHDDLHESAAMVLKFKDTEEKENQEKYFMDLIIISQKIMSLLDSLEKKIAQP